MATSISEHQSEPWRRRLILPNYQLKEVARYAGIAAGTVAAWHRIEQPTLSVKERGAGLSYLQLIEVAVVAAFRRARPRIPLKAIREAREYLKQELGKDYPFAQYQFKQRGKHLLLDYEQVEGQKGRGMHLVADQGGQLAWDVIVGPLLKEFEYEYDGIVIRWHVAGASSPIVIDPKIAFGAPTIRGTPTWVVKGRWDAGERDFDIAEDFGIDREDVREALRFEGVLPGGELPSRVH